MSRRAVQGLVGHRILAYFTTEATACDFGQPTCETACAFDSNVGRVTRAPQLVLEVCVPNGDSARADLDADASHSDERRVVTDDPIVTRVVEHSHAAICLDEL